MCITVALYLNLLHTPVYAIGIQTVLATSGVRNNDMGMYIVSIEAACVGARVLQCVAHMLLAYLCVRNVASWENVQACKACTDLSIGMIDG